MAKKQKTIGQLRAEHQLALARYTQTPSSPYLQNEVIKARARLDKALLADTATRTQGEVKHRATPAKQCTFF